MMVLRPGDVGDAVKALQRGLNNLGSMLLIDGQFGGGTREAISEARQTLDRPGPLEADDDLQAAIAAIPDLFLPLTTAGATFIARAEVAGPSQYRQKYQVPSWPSPTSGITIGIGYDCQFVTRERLLADWGGELGAETIQRLAAAVGIVGSRDLLMPLQDVVVPLKAAMTVFAKRSLADYLGRTRSIYPGIDALVPARRAALVSLVYNRGTRLSDNDPVRQDRLEMRAIRDLLASGQSDLVADQFDAMARLWDPATLPGLVLRRHAEATLWRAGFAALQLD
jgi:peptidoglycan hydrolase-like protein with peptidoglycan-binding domain